MNAIEALAARIQKLPEVVRWLHAQQAVILALGSGRSPHRGTNTKGVDFVLAAAGVIGAARVAAALGNLFLLVFLYLKQYITRRAAQPKGILLVGINALNESVLARYLEKLHRQPVWKLDERHVVSFAKYQRLSLLALLREWAAVWTEIWPQLTISSTRGGLPLNYCLSYLVTSGPNFIYSRLWFRTYLAGNIGNRPVIGFSAASEVCHAAVSAGAQAIYLTHGFQRHSLVFPNFVEVHCSNRFETAHFHARLPSAIVCIIPQTPRAFETRRIAVIAGDYWDEQEFDLCRSFIEWARQIKMPIIVRQHPAYRGNYWEQWRDVEGVEISDKVCDIETFLSEVRPRMLATWFSTILHDAVMNGIVPVTFAQDDFHLDDIVYPIRKIAINWPAQKDILVSLADDSSRSSSYVANLLALTSNDCGPAMIENMTVSVTKD